MPADSGGGRVLCPEKGDIPSDRDGLPSPQSLSPAQTRGSFSQKLLGTLTTLHSGSWLLSGGLGVVPSSPGKAAFRECPWRLGEWS